VPQKAKEKQKRAGPEPERVQIEGDWKKAVGKALKKKRPKDGWPEKPADSTTHQSKRQ